jgi:hypothetical protein
MKEAQLISEILPAIPHRNRAIRKTLPTVSSSFLIKSRRDNPRHDTTIPSRVQPSIFVQPNSHLRVETVTETKFRAFSEVNFHFARPPPASERQHEIVGRPKLIQFAFHNPSLRPIGSQSLLKTRKLNTTSMHLIAGVWGMGQLC